MTLWLVTGNFGSGKTAFLTRMCIKALHTCQYCRKLFRKGVPTDVPCPKNNGGNHRPFRVIANYPIKGCEYVKNEQIERLFFEDEVLKYQDVPEFQDVYPEFPNIVDKFKIAGYVIIKRGEKCLLALDEIWSLLDSRRPATSARVSVLINQSRKFGLDIIGASQLGSAVDKRYYNLITAFVYCQKVMQRDSKGQLKIIGFRYTKGDNEGITDKFIPFSAMKTFMKDYDTTFVIQPINTVIDEEFNAFETLRKMADIRMAREQRVAELRALSHGQSLTELPELETKPNEGGNE